MNKTGSGHSYDNINDSEPDMISSSSPQFKDSLQTDSTTLNNEPESAIYNPKALSKQASSSTIVSYSEIQESEPKPTFYDDQVSKESSEFEKAGVLNRLHFIFAIKQICRLRRKNPDEPLKLEDFNLLGRSEEVSHKILEFEKLFLEHRRRYKRSSLLIPLLKLFWRKLLVIQFFVIIFQVSKLLFTFVLRELLTQVQQSNQAQAYFWGFLLLLLIIFANHGNHQNFFYGNRLVGQLKPTLTGILYRKISRLSFYSINRVSIGKIVNIASNDLNSFENNLMMVCYLIFSPVVIIGALFFLWKEFGIASIPGIILILLTWPYQVFLSKIGGKYASQKNSATDERIKLTNEMIEGIRLLKMYSWEVHFSNLIESARDKELASIGAIKYTEQFAAHFLAKLAPPVGSFAIFLIYGLAGNTLTVEKVYSAIILMTFLGTSIMTSTCYALRFLVEARLTFQRIIEILDLEEFDHSVQQTHSDPSESSNAIEFSNFYAYWGEKKEATDASTHSRGNLVHDGITYDNSTLKDLSFTVKQGTLCAIVGKIGSGKSTALMSFFKEIPKVTGDLRFRGRLAYVEQEIVVYPGTVRSNILFGRPYKESFYNQVVEACCLFDDFREFPEADLMEIGERGVNLSGGQKARISLARALYSDADIYLLDDPLSAVDTKVAKSLFQNAIRGLLKDKTILLVTHQVHFAKEAEKIVVFDDGRVKAEGTLDEIIKKDSSIMSIFETEQDKKKIEKLEEEEEDVIPSPQKLISNAAAARYIPEKEDDSIVISKELADIYIPTKTHLGTGRLTSNEADESGRVGWSVYWYYFKNTGSFFSIFVLILCSATVEILVVMYTRSLGFWAQGKWEQYKAMALLSTMLLTLIGCTVCREVLFVRITNRASKALHLKALNRVIRATIEFFDTNPVGRVLNRFSNDFGVLDRQLMYVKNDLIDAIFYFGTLFVTVWVIVPWMLIPGILLMLFFFFFARFAKKVIIEGREIELLARGPIYSVFSTTLAGLVPIRVYNQQQRFLNDFVYLLNRHCRAFNGYLDSSRSFGFYCDLFSCIFACIGIAFMLSMKNIDPSLVGLICCYLLAISDHIQWCLRQALLYILMMSSTARVKAYSELQQEADLIRPKDRQLVDHNSWPSKGEVVFNNVYLKYRKDTDYVLKGLTFTVKPGEKIGCVGRTGAGKSSILQALFRMVEIDKEAVPGSFIKIDGEDTLNVGLHTIRENISIIPQAPFIFTGSVRRNLDPLNRYTDEQIARALKKLTCGVM